MGLKYVPENRMPRKALLAFAVWILAGALFVLAATRAGASLWEAFMLPALMFPMAVFYARPGKEMEVSENFIRDGREVYKRSLMKNAAYYDKSFLGLIRDCGIEFIYSVDGRENKRRISLLRFGKEQREKIRGLVLKLVPYEEKEKPWLDAGNTRIFRLRFWQWAFGEQSWFIPTLCLYAAIMAVYYIFNRNSPARPEFEYITVIVAPAALMLYSVVTFARWAWLSTREIKISDKAVTLYGKLRGKPVFSVLFSDIAQCEEDVKFSNLTGRKHVLKFNLNSGEFLTLDIGGIENEGEISQIFQERTGK